MRTHYGQWAVAAVLLMGTAGPAVAHGEDHGVSHRHRPMAVLAPFPHLQRVCAGQFVPDGWALADTQTNLAACGGSSPNNLWVLLDLKGAARGQTATLCQGPIPEGWVLTGTFTDATRCGGNLAGAFNNMMTVARL